MAEENVVEEEVVTEEDTQEEVKEESKTYTEDEVKKLIQAETDKRVSSALKTSKAKWEKEFEAEKEKVAETANMTAEEKARAEFEAQKDEWEKEKQEFERQKLELLTTKKLSSQGLPSDFASLVIGVDEEETDSNIETFKEYWKSALEDAVNERVKGATPRTGNSKPITAMTKEEFGKLGYKDRNRLLEKDPDLMKKLK